MRKHVGSAGAAMKAKEERIKKAYHLLMRNRNRFGEFFFIIIEHVPIGIGVEKQKKKTSENS